MSTSTKSYTTAYKKKVAEADMSLPKGSPKGVLQCSGCGAFYARRHWSLNPPGRFSTAVVVHAVYCPACRKMRDRFPGGELQLLHITDGERPDIALFSQLLWGEGQGRRNVKCALA